MPTFDQIESESETIAKRELKRLCDLPAYDEAPDMESVAERAHEIGIDYYLTLSAVHQSLINLTATALYHMFEQQVLFFHR